MPLISLHSTPLHHNLNVFGNSHFSCGPVQVFSDAKALLKTLYCVYILTNAIHMLSDIYAIIPATSSAEFSGMIQVVQVFGDIRPNPHESTMRNLAILRTPRLQIRVHGYETHSVHVSFDILQEGRVSPVTAVRALANTSKPIVKPGV